MRCLIVDDDPAMRAMLKHLLNPLAHCDLVFDGHEAVAVFRVALENGTPYDLVCMDIDMPLNNGHEALRAMRAIEETHGLLGLDGAKVIMITSMTASRHCVQAFREGCEMYLLKPLDRHRLLGAVETLFPAYLAAQTTV